MTKKYEACDTDVRKPQSESEKYQKCFLSRKLGVIFSKSN